MTVEAQGMWICWFGALKFNQNWIKHKKRRKNMPVFAVFEHFWRFFNFGRILAHQTTKFTFLDVYCFFWHPTHLWMWLSSAWKKIWPYLAECVMAGGHSQELFGKLSFSALLLLLLLCPTLNRNVKFCTKSFHEVILLGYDIFTHHWPS